MKDTYYFSHDYNARNDHKIKRLISKHGYLGYGLFWAIIEDLYNNANALQTDYESIAFDLRTSENIIESIINDFDLFVIEGDNFGSLSVQRRLEERDAKSAKARETAFKRWNKEKENANAMQTHSECNAIKESKVKEIESKGININDKIETFKTKVYSYNDIHSVDMLYKFFNYWSELNKSGTKMRFELEKTWEIEKRLTTWKNNNDKFEKNNKTYESQKPIIHSSGKVM
jgi:hypothetical protein